MMGIIGSYNALATQMFSNMLCSSCGNLRGKFSCRTCFKWQGNTLLSTIRHMNDGCLGVRPECINFSSSLMHQGNCVYFISVNARSIVLVLRREVLAEVLDGI